jgi:hypothetical protein
MGSSTSRKVIGGEDAADVADLGRHGPPSVPLGKPRVLDKVGGAVDLRRRDAGRREPLVQLSGEPASVVARDQRVALGAVTHASDVGGECAHH